MEDNEVGQTLFRDRPLREWLFACIPRLVDDFPWTDHVEVIEERCDIESMIVVAMLSNPDVAQQFVAECLEYGIIEEDYFEQDY